MYYIDTTTTTNNILFNKLYFFSRIDQIEDDMIHEKLKIKAISDDLDGTFKSMTSI